MKCVAKLTTEDPNPEHKILCDVETDHLYHGSSLCTPHVIEGYELADSESGFGGLFKGLEKITLDDVAKVSSMMRPLMDAFSSGAMRVPTPAICTRTQGCFNLAGHVGECTITP